MRQEFTPRTKLDAWKRSNGHCENCGIKIIAGNGPEYDHIVAAALGGAADLDNCAVLCRNCHGAKTAQHDIPKIAKSNRVIKRNAGIKRRKGKPMPGSKASGWRKRMDGTVERR